MQKPFSPEKVYFLVQTFDLSDFEYKSFDRIPSLMKVIIPLSFLPRLLHFGKAQYNLKCGIGHLEMTHLALFLI